MGLNDEICFRVQQGIGEMETRSRKEILAIFEGNTCD